MKKIVTAEGEIIDAPPIHEAIPAEGPFFKTPHNHDRDAESAATGLLCLDESRTQQQFTSDADINKILAKFLNTGQITTTGQTPVYQDAEDEFDLQESIVTAYQVEQAWNELPTAVRNILKTPRTFIDYVDHCMETGDLDPLRELGLAKPAEPNAEITSPTQPQPGPPPAPPPAS